MSRLASALEVTPEFLLSGAAGTPDEKVVDEVFFRKYQSLPDLEKKKLRRILDAWEDE
jgi:hypothetical protein